MQKTGALRPCARAKKNGPRERDALEAGNPATLPTPSGLHSEVAPCVEVSFIEAERRASSQTEKRLAQISGAEAPGNRAFSQIAYDTNRSTHGSCPEFPAPSTISGGPGNHCETSIGTCGVISPLSARRREAPAGAECAAASSRSLAKQLRLSLCGGAGALRWTSSPTKSRTSRSNAPTGRSSFRRSLGGAL